jgi:flagellar protein FlaG
MDEETGIQVVKIIDSQTKEVIRQLPPETTLKIAKYIDEITGLLFEKKA